MLGAATLLLPGCDLEISGENRGLPFAPASVSIDTDANPLRVVVLGDFGWGGKGQQQIADAIAKIHRRDPLDLGITVGDNFYEHGVKNISDRKWTERWEQPYGGLGVVFYPSLGNHDYYGSVRAQLDYVSPSGTWRMPARTYRLRAGNTEFFALDTMDPSPAQFNWLREALADSTAKWKIVYGHHPVYSAGRHGDGPEMEQLLLPLIRGKAILYMAGHDHQMEHLKPVDGTHFFVSGGGGAKLHGVSTKHPRLLFGKRTYGFTVMSIGIETIAVEMFGEKANLLYRTEVRNELPAASTGLRSGGPAVATVEAALPALAVSAR